MLPNDAAARAGVKALEHVDAVLAKRPEKDGPALSAALRCLGEYRDGLVGAQRQAVSDPLRGKLEHVNAVISCIMAIQYPLGEVQWPELAKARAWLSDCLVE